MLLSSCRMRCSGSSPACTPIGGVGNPYLYGRVSAVLFPQARSRRCGLAGHCKSGCWSSRCCSSARFLSSASPRRSRCFLAWCPEGRLVPANARLDQTEAAAQTLGPAIGGGLVGLLGAPMVIAVDAISYLVDAALNASIRVDEPRPESRIRNFHWRIRDGCNGHIVIARWARWRRRRTSGF